MSKAIGVSFHSLFLGSGQKKWHQDNAYFRLTPARVVVSQENNLKMIIDLTEKTLKFECH